MSDSLVEKKQVQILVNLDKIAYTLDKAYMSKLDSDYAVVTFDALHNSKESSITYEHNIRAVKINKWVFDRDEKPGKCLKNALSAFADGDHTLALVVKRTPTDTQMYFVVRDEGEGKGRALTNLNLLKDTLTGNFQGTSVEEIRKVDELEKIFSFDGDNINSIALLNNTPSEYSEDYVGQGLDKLLNGVVPKDEYDSYTVVFLAESLSPEALVEIMSGYEDMATAISPFEQHQFQTGVSKMATKGENTSETQSEMKSLTDSQSLSDSISKTHSINVGANIGINLSKSNFLSGALNAGLNCLVSAGASVAVGIASALGLSGGISCGYGYGWGNTKTDTKGTSETNGTSKSSTQGTSRSLSIGTSENTTYTYKNYKISNMLEKLNMTMDRINKSKATGLWKFSTYIMSEKAKTTRNIANVLKGITQGKKSYIEPAFIQEWTNLKNKTELFSEIKKYLHYFTHPVFFTDDQNGNNAMAVTATSFVATDELSNVIVFPKKSLQGLPVLHGTQFGREPHSLIELEYDLPLGKGYHMHQVYDKQKIAISSKNLCKHTFITGSTGSGKSNAVYNIIKQIHNKKVHFLVIEPAKGEYKDFFGNKKGVTVYGTNPMNQDIKLLKINPFSFPVESIHVLEHIDRLVEIFNVCWPMYAAMPAVLKDAIILSYENAGWDLSLSLNKYDNRIFPTFADVLNSITKVMSNSEYSDEIKGNYSGALKTRLMSLTNGINGQIFCNDSISDTDLYDKDVIVDLSRVGSSETKSLIMGILVLKLQEHRMSGNEINSDLKHITVLEEAHNLLRRTSFEQFSESSNLMGKSVEMLANAIAEMRTYGEGFIIADQSPGLLDMSVIRNTNTKIILRLPDYSDRELVGKAAGLNDQQIVELGKLEMGVAVLSQNDWLEPVLCKIDKFEKGEKLIKAVVKPAQNVNGSSLTFDEIFMDYLLSDEDNQRNEIILSNVKERLIKSNLDAGIKCEFLKYILHKSNKAKSNSCLRKICFDYFNASKAIERANGFANSAEKWSKIVYENLMPSFEKYDKIHVNNLILMILKEAYNKNLVEDDDFESLIKYYSEKGGFLC